MLSPQHRFLRAPECRKGGPAVSLLSRCLTGLQRGGYKASLLNTHTNTSYVGLTYISLIFGTIASYHASTNASHFPLFLCSVFIFVMTFRVWACLYVYTTKTGGGSMPRDGPEAARTSTKKKKPLASSARLDLFVYCSSGWFLPSTTILPAFLNQYYRVAERMKWARTTWIQGYRRNPVPCLDKVIPTPPADGAWHTLPPPERIFPSRPRHGLCPTCPNTAWLCLH